jgi:hypothetical protein
MIGFQTPDINIVRQCKLFKISCTSVYYKPKMETHHPKSDAQDKSIFASEIMY